MWFYRNEGIPHMRSEWQKRDYANVNIDCMHDVIPSRKSYCSKYIYLSGGGDFCL